MSTTADKVEVAECDIRFVIEPVLTLTTPSEHYAAHIEVYKSGPRGGSKRYVQVGPRVINENAADALYDLQQAIAQDLLPGVVVA